MRGLAIIVILLAFAGSLWLVGCSTTGEAGTERIIRAEPAEIVENVGRELGAGGMTLVSRSARGDVYERILSAPDMSAHPALAPLAGRGAMTLRARVSRSGIEFTSRFQGSETIVGFMINLSPAPDGEGTLAQMQPILRGASGTDRQMAERLRRSFATRGTRMLETIARSAES